MNSSGRHVHLGTRMEVAERVRSGRVTAMEAARDLGVEEREVRRWVRLVAMMGAGKDKASDLVVSALVRARFCELLSPKVQHGDSDLFLMGLLSVMDAILEMPMSKVLEKVPVDQETKSLLSGGASRLRPLYQLMLARESGEWKVSSEFSRQLRLSDSEVAEAYWQALQWARQVGSE